MSWLDDALTWLKNLWEKDSNKILTTATVIGVGVVAVEGVKAGIQIEKARPLVEEEIAKKEEELGRPLKKTESMWLKTQMYFPAVVPLGIYSTLEVIGIHVNNKIAMDKIAGWKLVCSMKDKENKLLKDEMSKVLTEKEQKKLEQNVLQRKADEGKDVPEEQIIKRNNMLESGQFASIPNLYYEPATNQYFFSDDNEIRKAFAKVDKEIHQGASWTNINFALWNISNAIHNAPSGEVLGYTPRRNGSDGVNLKIGERYVVAPNGMNAKVVETDYGEKDYDLDGYSGDGAWNGRSRW